jgi:hypothetical protein
VTLVLTRNRLTRTAAERRFVLSGECVPGGVVDTVWLGAFRVKGTTPVRFWHPENGDRGGRHLFRG